MKSRTRISAILAIVAGVTCAGSTPLFHVAPSPRGDDGNEGSARAPFASLDRARQAVRAHLATNDARADVVVELDAGTYELSAPVRFETADSGENGFSVVYRARAGARVVLSGGRAVRGWTREAGGNLRAALQPNVDFRQLWVNGERGIRARTPNEGSMLTLATEKQRDGFDLPREPLKDVELQGSSVEVSVLIAWMHKRLRIASVAETADPATVRAVIEPGEWDGIVNQPQGDRVYLGRRYWLENAREFLDAPGEFFLDRRAGAVTYRPRPGDKAREIEAIRPELEHLILLEGRLDAPVHHLRFEGLTFAYTGWTRPNRHGFVDVQANSLIPAAPADAVDAQYRHNQRKDRIPAALHARTADNIVVRRCRFEKLGGTGILFAQGGNDNIIEGNHFTDIAGGGIELGDDAARPNDPRVFPRRNRVANNFITRIGQDYYGSVGILGYYTDGSEITHNEIVDVPYTPISQGWGWGNPPAPPESRANRITHNLVTNFMLRLDDGGGIYTTDRQPGSVIAHNVIENMLPPDKNTKAGGAIYLDQFTEGYHVHDNVVTNAIRWLFIWNPNIRGNRVESNFADTPALRNDGRENVVEPVNVVRDGNWPDAARAIRSAAGLQPAYRDIK